MSFSYDPNDTQRDRPRRSSLTSHKYLLEHHRKGSVPALTYDAGTQPMPRRSSVAQLRRPSYAPSILSSAPRSKSIHTPVPPLPAHIVGSGAAGNELLKAATRKRAQTLSSKDAPAGDAAEEQVGHRPELKTRRATAVGSATLIPPSADDLDVPKPNYGGQSTLR